MNCPNVELEKQITFDGFNFWLKDEKIGTIKPKYQMKSPIPKETMQAEKRRVLCEIINCAEVA